MNLYNDNMKFNVNFDVPNGYFDSLADNVMANIKFEESRRNSRRRIVLRVFSAAAVLCVFLILGVVLKPETGHGSQASIDYNDYVAESLEESCSDYNVMQYLEYDELPYGELSDADLSNWVAEYYASPVNLYIYH